MKRWSLALLVLGLSAGIQWAALYVERTFKVPATSVVFWSIYAVFPASAYIVGRMKPLWLAVSAFITVLAGEDLVSENLLDVLAVLAPKAGEMDFPDMIFGFYFLPAIVLSVPAFIVGAVLARLKRRDLAQAPVKLSDAPPHRP